jgi:hypothetical protein
VAVLTNIAMLPVRDVLLYESIDRALGLPSKDWNRKFHDLFDPLIAGQAKSKQVSAAERIADAPPTHPLSTYVGVFAADGYPDFGVRLNESGQLEAALVGSLDWTTFRHYHYNVFEWHWADFDLWSKVRFLINDNGEVDSVAIPIEPMVEDVIFARKEPELDKALIDAVLGVYAAPMDGVVYTVSTHQDKLYFTETGMAGQEMTAYRVDDQVMGFRIKRTRLDFELEDGQVTRLWLKAPGMTLEAPRMPAPA